MIRDQRHGEEVPQRVKRAVLLRPAGGIAGRDVDHLDFDWRERPNMFGEHVRDDRVQVHRPEGARLGLAPAWASSSAGCRRAASTYVCCRIQLFDIKSHAPRGGAETRARRQAARTAGARAEVAADQQVRRSDSGAVSSWRRGVSIRAVQVFVSQLGNGLTCVRRTL